MKNRLKVFGVSSGGRLRSPRTQPAEHSVRGLEGADQRQAGPDTGGGKSLLGPRGNSASLTEHRNPNPDYAWGIFCEDDEREVVRGIIRKFDQLRELRGC
jgi:hypothetical protein